MDFLTVELLMRLAMLLMSSSVALPSLSSSEVRVRVSLAAVTFLLIGLSLTVRLCWVGTAVEKSLMLSRPWATGFLLPLGSTFSRMKNQSLLSYSSLFGSRNMVTRVSLFSGTGHTHIPT